MVTAEPAVVDNTDLPGVTAEDAGPPAKTPKRQHDLDALRGFFLVWMTLTHLPTHVSYYTNQPVGFVSAAEGFIFLSAFLSGRIFGRKWYEKGPWTITARLLKRAARLYSYHLFLLAIAFTVVASIAVHTKQPSLEGLIDFYLAHPVLGLVSSVLLIYRPPLLDILPMYIIFLASTPSILFVGRRWGWNWVLVPSFSIWLAAQFGLRNLVYNVTGSLTGFHIPLGAMGAFDLYAWQFLWVAGVCMGCGGAQRLERLARSKAFILLLTLAAVGFVFIRHSYLWNNLNAAPWIPFTDKWRLASLRLVNFAILGMLFAAWKDRLARWIAIPPLVVMGKASLEVFCAHLLICFEALALVGDGTGLAVGPQAAIVISALLALYIVGRAFA